MNCEIIRVIDPLNRQRWEFSLVAGTSNILFFDRYSIEYKENLRQRLWRTKGYWNRLMQRESTIKTAPEIPLDVGKEMREYFANKVKELPIKT